METLAHRSRLPTLGALMQRQPWTPSWSAKRDTRIHFDTVRDLDGLEALGPEWRGLFETCGRPHQVFQTFEWLAIWARLYIQADTRLSIVTGRIDGRIVLIWPLVIRQSFGLRILSGMGEPLSQYGDALIAPELGEMGEDAAFAYVLQLPADVMSFRRVRDDAAIAPMLLRQLRAPDNRQMSPFVDLAGLASADSFEQRFPGKIRSSRRRRRRRLEDRGAVTFTHHGPSPEAAALVATALGFKRDWAHRARVLSPALRDPRFEQFFIAAASAGCNAPDLRVSVLQAGSDIVGIEISVACKGRLFGHVLAPRPGFETLGVGGILAELTIASAIEQGHQAVDLLAPADAYKLEWSTTCVGVGDYSLSRTLVGFLYMRLWLQFGRSAVKTIARQLQPGMASLAQRFKGHSQT